MSGHERVLCMDCGTVIRQCRCPAGAHNVTLGLCRECEVLLDRAVQEEEDQVLGDNIILGDE